MSLLSDTIWSHLPYKRKQTPSGWTSFSAVCCHHRGHKIDKRGRSGIIISNEVISYSCFNCGFKASWQPGRNLTLKMKKLLEWLGVPTDLITKISFDILKLNQDIDHIKYIAQRPTFEAVRLPSGAQLLSETHNEEVLPVLEYMAARNLYMTDTNFYWSPESNVKDRFIIPFYYGGECVGYTARTCRNNTIAKYLTHSQPGYIYGIDAQPYDRPYAIVCEGPIDALHVNGLAILGSDLNQQQTLLLNSTGKKIIVVPDRDKAGSKLIEMALDNEYFVSMPPWSDEINDISDAVAKYGRTLTLYSIMKYKEQSSLKIKLRMKKWIK